jgi:peroxiredoxin/outer membrane lipoprotein-sorting protein
MVETIQNATTLSYESNYRTERGQQDPDHGTYRVWMKKPNCFYVETRLGDGQRCGVIVGDGQYAWSFWPNGRPWFSGEDESRYQKTRANVYMKEPAAPGKYAIRYSTVMKKSNFFPVVDPSVFQGGRDSLEPLIDWMREVGTEQVGDEGCRIIEVSYADHQRSCYFWISKRDNLPRRLKRLTRGTRDLVDEEQWSQVTLNGAMPQERFTWKPPEGWQPWQPPTMEERLLKPGQKAPDFELSSPDGSKIKLSAYRGKIVWLSFWRVQCPPCREEIPYLESLYQECKNEGLVVLGFDFADDVKSASDFLREHAATFPCIVDSSDEAVKAGFFAYAAKAAPVNYIIDRDGKIAAAWLGYEKGDTQGIEALGKLGLKGVNR